MPYIDAPAERYAWAPPDDWSATMLDGEPILMDFDGPAVAENGDWEAVMGLDAPAVLPPDDWMATAA